ncbi:MAG: NAD(P)H-quinone oxidoreductase [Micrococcales bacterium]|nr:NAD(P)H-quinone oxidoreductase [Micrococcales bacterium]
MRAVTIPTPGGPDVLRVEERPDPVPGRSEVVISVAAAGVNRADLHQREGNYPPPSGAPDWPGLEVSGTIVAAGDAVADVKPGDRVCALLSGGGYAELAAAPAGLVLPVPEVVDLKDAAGLPEAMCTVWSTVFMSADLRSGETLLVHGGSGGIGTMSIQLARAIGCRVAVTAGSDEKLEACRALGADILVNYRDQDFVEIVLAATEGRGADVILDAIGGGYLDRNLRALAPHGRIELIGNQSGVPGELSVGRLMAKWGTIRASTLRARPLAEKEKIVASVLANAWPLVASKQVRPTIDRSYRFKEARRAHEAMESGNRIGKLLLVP